MDHHSDSLHELEPRFLFSSAFKRGDALIIYGDGNAPNTITVARTPDGDHVLVTINGGATQSFSNDDLGPVRIFGGNLNDRIEIQQADRTFNIKTFIFALAGNDTVICGKERDYVNGGDGNDTIRDVGGRNKICGGRGNDTITAGSERDLIIGNDGNDLIRGGDLRDRMYGNDGNDTIIGDDGSDLIFAGNGNDSVVGGDGKDIIFGQDGNDTLASGDDRDSVFGMAGSDLIDGGEEDDTVWGGAGTDVLRGGGGGGDFNQGEYGDIRRLIFQLDRELGKEEED